MKKLSGFCMLVGIALLLGTAGGSDLGTMDFKTIVLLGVISVVLLFVGIIGNEIADEQ